MTNSTFLGVQDELVAKLERVLALEALVEEYGETLDAHGAGLDCSWVLSCGALVVLMQLGFAMLESGAVREHNVLATYAKNMLDFTLGIGSAFAFGYEFSYQQSPISFQIDDAPAHQSFFFYVAFQATSVTIVSGAMAERTALVAYACFSVFVSGLIHPLAVRWTWGGGWLAELDPGFHDFAGSGVVHALGGTVAAVGAAIVGSRHGRWEKKNELDFAPHNTPSVVVGTLLLWVGWYGFNPGSTTAMSSFSDAALAGNSAMTTTLAAAGAAGTTLFIDIATVRMVDITNLCNALLAGLVAITAGTDSIDPGWSVVVGVVGCLMYRLCSWTLKKIHVDDVIDAFAVHGGPGIWGVLCVGLFDRDLGLVIVGTPGLLLTQAIGIGSIVGISAIPTLVILGAARAVGRLRVSQEVERTGLDCEFAIQAYARRADELQYLKDIAEVISTKGFSPLLYVDGLISLKEVIYRPLTPQAADNKLEGEVRDICEHLVVDATKKHLCFVSHHKADGGDAARIFVDTTRRVLASSSTSDRLGNLASSVKEGGELLFLDSTNLKDLGGLLDHVKDSANFVLLLTRRTLQRPWCCAELCVAIEIGINLCVVVVEWAGGDARSFSYPEHLNQEIMRWEDSLVVKTLRASAQPKAEKTSMAQKMLKSATGGDKAEGEV